MMADANSVNDEINGVGGNGPLPWRRTAMLYTANLLGLGNDYAFPETSNTSPSLLDQVTTLAKLLTRKMRMPDGNEMDIWDAAMTICKQVIIENPHINDDEKNSVNYKEQS